MRRLNKVKKNYEEVVIPAELEELVKTTIQQAIKPVNKKRYRKQWLIATAAAAALFIGSINISPTFAQAMSNVPLLGMIADVFTVQQLKVDRGSYQADLNTPAVDGLSNKGLQAALNNKYIEENKGLYEEFKKEVAALDEIGGGHTGVASGYEVITDTDLLLAIERYQMNTVGSSSTIMKYDTVDKRNGVLITLPSLFKNEGYIDTISNYVLKEMHAQVAASENVSYFFTEEDSVGFEKIHPHQQFYIIEDNKLVISFDKYEIAPGSMGTITFEIPTELIKDELVSDLYIK